VTDSDRIAALEARDAQLEARMAALEATLGRRADLVVIRNIVKDRLFTVREIYDHAAVVNDPELTALLAATTPRKLGRLLAHTLGVEACGADSTGKIWRFTNSPQPAA
jgi:hypothetical protein